MARAWLHLCSRHVYHSDSLFNYLIILSIMYSVSRLYTPGDQTHITPPLSTLLTLKVAPFGLLQEERGKEEEGASGAPSPLVGVIMGSDSDLPTMKAAADILEEFRVPYELTIVSAHRTPGRMMAYATVCAFVFSPLLGLDYFNFYIEFSRLKPDRVPKGLSGTPIPVSLYFLHFFDGNPLNP